MSKKNRRGHPDLRGMASNCVDGTTMDLTTLQVQAPDQRSNPRRTWGPFTWWGPLGQVG